MSAFQSFIQHLEQWRRKYQLQRFHLSSKVRHCSAQATATTTVRQPGQTHPLRRVHPPLMFALAVVSLTSVVGYRFYNQPKLAVDTVSPITIKAPEDGRFQDSKTTEEERKKARNGVVPILKRDLETTEQIKQEIQSFLAQIEQLRQTAGLFPFIPTDRLSLASQRYILSLIHI